jgi:protein-S-isoprenylcysteine O-methyltransferase Ste14
VRGIGYGVVAVGTFAWFLPLILQRRKSTAAQKVNPRARWGLLLVGAGYAIPWQTAFLAISPRPWRIWVSAASFIAAIALSWAAAGELGRHWRIEAGLSADHELVQTGVYGLVRHPIYTSMLLVIVATCVVLSPLYLLPVSVLLYVAGTEIRVRAEEALLAERFGAAFRAYRERVPAYLPLPRGPRHGRGSEGEHDEAI